MPITYNAKMVIPGLDKFDAPTLAAMLYIQNYINGQANGAYASLTGSGETTTPGALTQQGPFTAVTATGDIGFFDTAVGGQIELEQTDTGGNISIIAAGTLRLLSLDQPITMEGGTTGTVACLFIQGTSPNGALTSINQGDLCIDTGTPGLWQATAAASTVWTAL